MGRSLDRRTIGVRILCCRLAGTVAEHRYTAVDIDKVYISFAAVDSFQAVLIHLLPVPVLRLQDDWEKDKYNQNYPNASNPQINFSQDYHVFAATWTPSVMTWYVDGVPFVSRYPGVSNPPTLFIPSWPLYMIMNTAIANWAPSGMPQPPVWHTDTVYHYVDWVKVWQWSDSNEAEMLTAGSQ